MKKAEELNQAFKVILPILTAGGIGVLPTDTLYGLVGSALSKKTVEQIYELRKRDLKKPMIILVASLHDLKLFGLKLTATQKKFLQKVWPGKVSVVLACPDKKVAYLHRGTKSLAFRVPADEALRKFLKKAGPLVAPSANLAGEKPAETYVEAQRYFRDKIDFYVDAGTLKSKPSTIVKLSSDGSFQLLREGAVKM